MSIHNSLLSINIHHSWALMLYMITPQSQFTETISTRLMENMLVDNNRMRSPFLMGIQGCQEDFWGPGQGFEMRPLHECNFLGIHFAQF